MTGLRSTQRVGRSVHVSWRMWYLSSELLTCLFCTGE